MPLLVDENRDVRRCAETLRIYAEAFSLLGKVISNELNNPSPDKWRTTIMGLEKRISNDEGFCGFNGPLIFIREMYDEEGMNGFMLEPVYLPSVLPALKNLAGKFRLLADYIQGGS